MCPRIGLRPLISLRQCSVEKTSRELTERLAWRCCPDLIPILIGFSRMYIGAHYPSDVVCAAVLGTLCALAVAVFPIAGNGESAIENRKLKWRRG